MGFLGMRGTGDWVADQRPKSWREAILYLYPNGMAPLTAILSMMKSEKVNDPEFYWWTQTQSSVQGAVSGVYTLPDLSVAYVNGGVAGDILYVVTTAALGTSIREGHQILLRDASDYAVDVNGKVVGVNIGGANTVLSVKLLEDDDNSTTHDLSDCDNFKIIGNLNPEGGEMPDSISQDPSKVYNKTQIWRTPLSLTRTALQTRLRTGDAYQKAKKEALEMHSWEMELSYIWGIMTENIGDNGKPERTTRGIIDFIRTYSAANVDDFTTNATYAGLDWTDAYAGVTAGQHWIDTMLEQIFRYGAGEKLVLCGSGALLGLQRTAQAGGTIQLNVGQKAYGMKITEWITPFGSIYLKTHPLFSFDATTRHMGIVLEPSELKYRFIQDTEFFGENSSKTHPEGYGNRRLDGLNEEWLTEAGLEFGLAQKCGLLNGIGQNSSLP
jgi:hypothetical protein